MMLVFVHSLDVEMTAMFQISWLFGTVVNVLLSLTWDFLTTYAMCVQVIWNLNTINHLIHRICPNYRGNLYSFTSIVAQTSQRIG